MNTPVPGFDADDVNALLRRAFPGGMPEAFRLWTEGPDRLAAQTNLTYALPQP